MERQKIGCWNAVAIFLIIGEANFDQSQICVEAGQLFVNSLEGIPNGSG